MSNHPYPRQGRVVIKSDDALVGKMHIVSAMKKAEDTFKEMQHASKKLHHAFRKVVKKSGRSKS